MKVLIVGGGYAGCCVAKLLKEDGHKVLIFEKDNCLGGMARSYYKDGLTYEFGPHIIANHWSSRKAISFLKKYVSLKKTTLEAASFFDGIYTNYPPHIDSIFSLKQKKKIVSELYKLNLSQPCETSFEAYVKSRLGETLYNLYYKNYTKKFWRVEPAELDAEWAKTRKIGDNFTKEENIFNDGYYPKNDFNELFSNLSSGIETHLSTAIAKIDLKQGCLFSHDGTKYKGDLIITTQRLDEIFDFSLGQLEYRGYQIIPKIINKPYYHPINPLTNRHYAIAYYPETNKRYARITDYKSINRKGRKKAWRNRTIITIETPNNIADFYPFPNQRNHRLFQKYIKLIANYPKVIILGRRGLYKYTTLDTTTEQVFRLMPIIYNWQQLSSAQRYQQYFKIRGSWQN